MATCSEILDQKSSWPELVGKNSTEAAAIVEKEAHPDVEPVVILDGTVIPEIFKCNRVILWVDSNGVVVQVPTIG